MSFFYFEACENLTMELTRDPPLALGIIRKPQDILICCVCLQETLWIPRRDDWVLLFTHKI